MPRTISATSDTPATSSDPIVRGLNLGIFGRVINTSSAKTRLSILITATLASDVYVIAHSIVRFNASEAKLVSSVWAIPSTATAGEYVIKVEVESNGTVIATGTKSDQTVSAS